MPEFTHRTSKLWESIDVACSHWVFHCPGCGHLHAYVVGGGTGPRWTFNGNMEKPTFTPSLRNSDLKGTTCHLFLTDGVIHFCGDCPHPLAGKSVPMEDI